jgi:hypothetical protein
MNTDLILEALDLYRDQISESNQLRGKENAARPLDQRWLTQDGESRRATVDECKKRVLDAARRSS